MRRRTITIEQHVSDGADDDIAAMWWRDLCDSTEDLREVDTRLVSVVSEPFPPIIVKVLGDLPEGVANYVEASLTEHYGRPVQVVVVTP